MQTPIVAEKVMGGGGYVQITPDPEDVSIPGPRHIEAFQKYFG